MLHIQLFAFFSLFCLLFHASAIRNMSCDLSHDHILPGMEFPEHPGTVSPPSDTGCIVNTTPIESSKKAPLRFHLKQTPVYRKTHTNKKELLKSSTTRDILRIQTLHKRRREKKNLSDVSRLNDQKIHTSFSQNSTRNEYLETTIESGVSLNLGEYFIDVFIGTPPKHFHLILDTGSDLNWIQCLPCYDCFNQHGPKYNPNKSSSFREISCKDPRCSLVSSPDPPQPCKSENQTCPYFYWYGDQSNTTGDFALETFTVNLTSSDGETEFKKVENIMFGCGHWNRGLFHGASGLLGLGRGSLSFSSQIQHIYGHSFSYCLVDRNSDLSVQSKLIFGEEQSLINHPNLNFTSFVPGKENSVDTFYYIQIKSIMVGGEELNIPKKIWSMLPDGTGGTIIDSGTTLSYFLSPAYQAIKAAFEKKVKYPKVDLPLLDLCYNISDVKEVEMPEFAISFTDGAVWNFPMENYFLTLDPEGITCLALLGNVTNSPFSILGNYQQQNFHILYDTEKSRLGFAPMKCADV